MFYRYNKYIHHVLCRDSRNKTFDLPNAEYEIFKLFYVTARRTDLRSESYNAKTELII